MNILCVTNLTPKKLGLNNLNPKNNVKQQILNLGQTKTDVSKGGGGGPNTSTVLGP